MTIGAIIIGLLVLGVVWWVVRRLIALAVVAALIVGVVVWGSHADVHAPGHDRPAQQLHRAQHNVERTVTRALRHEVARVRHSH